MYNLNWKVTASQPTLRQTFFSILTRGFAVASWLWSVNAIAQSDHHLHDAINSNIAQCHNILAQASCMHMRLLHYNTHIVEFSQLACPLPPHDGSCEEDNRVNGQYGLATSVAF